MEKAQTAIIVILACGVAKGGKGSEVESFVPCVAMVTTLNINWLLSDRRCNIVKAKDSDSFKIS